MPTGHTVKIGEDWVDGFLVGKAAALSEWSLRKEINDPEFERLIDCLRQKRYWANLPPEKKAWHLAYRKKWREENKERYDACVLAAKRRGRKQNAAWYRNERVRRRAKEAALTAERRKEVYTCVVCDAQWCIAFGRVPTQRPKYCTQSCRGRANYLRAKAAGAPWAKHNKAASRCGTCGECGGVCDTRAKRCSGCYMRKK